MQGTVAQKYCDTGTFSIILYSVTLGQSQTGNAEYFFILPCFLALTVNKGATFVTVKNVPEP